MANSDFDITSSGPRDYWTKDGVFFAHYGMKYGIAKGGATICLGPVEEKEKVEVLKVAAGVQGAILSADDSTPVKKKAVSKIPDKGIIPVANYAPEKQGIMKQRGRPRKEGEVSRVTKWRREKEELQGQLL